jgi:hypothetical protein
MKHFILSVVVLMITSTTTFAQHIGKAYIGLSLDETIEQCMSVGYEFVEKGDDCATFLIPNNIHEYDVDVTLVMYASPATKTVWFGIMKFSANSKKEAKATFFSVNRAITEKFGNPDKKRRKVFSWTTGYSIIDVQLERTRVSYTVISTGAFNKIESEY